MQIHQITHLVTAKCTNSNLILDLSNDFVQKLNPFDMENSKLSNPKYGPKKLLSQIHLYPKSDFMPNNCKKF